MKFLLALLAGAALSLSASPLLDLTNAGIPLDRNEKGIVVSDEQGKALHTSKFWRKSSHLHSREVKNFPSAKYSKVTNTAEGIKIVTDKSLASVTFPGGARYSFSTRLYASLPLKPEYVGKKLIVSFKVRGQFYSVPSINYIYGGILFRNAKTRKSLSDLGRKGMPRKLETMTFAAPVPKGMTHADLHFALYGCGELEILQATVKVGEGSDAMSPDVIISTSGYTDRKFYLPYKESFPVMFAFRREFSYKPKSFKLFVELPKGFTCTGYGLEMSRLKDQSGACVFSALRPFLRTITRNTFCNWGHNAVLIRADAAPSEKFHTMRYWVEADGKPSVPRTIQLKVVPFEKHAAPRGLMSGLHYPAFNAARFDGQASEAFTAMYKNCGFNMINARIFPELSAALKKASIARVGNGMPMRNGYKVYGKVAPDQGFVDISGKVMPGVFCPVSVYERKSSYLSAVVNFCQKNLGPGGMYDHGEGNWEPFMYDFKGCFCKNCCAEFARYLKKDVKEIEKIWPREVMKHYRQEWIAFRSWQHGKLMVTVNEDVKKAGSADKGKRSYFIPDISYYGFTDAMAKQHGSQYAAKDFAAGLDRICIWGPYAVKASLHGKYNYVPAQHLAHLLACDHVNRFLRRLSKATVMGLPQGSHVNWVTTPEAVVFETLSGFVAGHTMSTPFWFAYDYRAYREMGRMNSLLRKIESELVQKNVSQKVKGTVTTPCIDARHWRPVVAGTPIERMFPEIMKTSALQLRRFNNGQKILIAAANVWEKGGVFFKLQLPDMKGKGAFVVTDVEKNESLKVTADELAKGVELYIPELHWSFFRIEPFEKGKQYTFTTVQKITGLKKRLMPQLKKALAEEDKLLAESGGKQLSSFDFDAAPEIRSGDLVCRRIAGSKYGEVEIAAPGYRIVIDPARSGRISSWKINGVETALGQDTGLGFGVIGCWMPHYRLLKHKYTLTDVQSIGDKLMVELTLGSDRKNSLGVKSRYFFDAKGFRQEMTVTNEGKMATDIMVRFHTFSAMIAGGTVTAKGKEIPVLPHVVFYRNGKEIPNAEAPMRAEKTFVQFMDHCVIAKKGVPFKLEFKGENLYGVMMWSNPGQTAASFEPTYAPALRVAPGKSVKAAQEWHFQK